MGKRDRRPAPPSFGHSLMDSPGREDSNLRPPGPEPGALPVNPQPGELLIHIVYLI
jgi:hypothetical protein